MCVQKIWNANKNTEEQSYKSKWWHFCLCIWMLCYVVCFKNRMCNIRDRNHIVCIILILFCGSIFFSLSNSLFGCCSWFKGCTCLCVYILPLLTSIELNGIDVMRCYVIATSVASVFLFSGLSVTVAMDVTVQNHIIILKISQKTIKIIINSQRAS